MLVNSTSSDQLLYFCSESKVGLFISIGMIATKTVLVLPLSTFLLYLGHGFWRQQRSFSHTDIFTFHLAVNELFWVFGLIGYISGTYRNNLTVQNVGVFGFCVTIYGEMFFHLLTCVERFLAVVHPVTYLKFKNARGVRIRNVSLGCVWLLCFGLACFYLAMNKNLLIAMDCVLFFNIVVITFCSISVLRVLVRPGPGGGVREKVDQVKRRAFHTISAISSVLWLWFVLVLISYSLSASSALSPTVDCLMSTSLVWFSLPTSLVSPLLFLQREGKLALLLTLYSSQQVKGGLNTA